MGPTGSFYGGGTGVSSVKGTPYGSWCHPHGAHDLMGQTPERMPVGARHGKTGRQNTGSSFYACERSTAGPVRLRGRGLTGRVRAPLDQDAAVGIASSLGWQND